MASADRTLRVSSQKNQTDGQSNAEKTAEKVQRKKTKEVEHDRQGKMTDEAYAVGRSEEDILKEAKEIGGSKREKMDKKWKKLEVEELELFIRRCKLVKREAKLVLNHYEKMDED